MPLSWNLAVRWDEKLRPGGLISRPFLIAAALWAIALCPSQAALLPVAPDDVPLLNLAEASASNHIVIGPETAANLSNDRLSARPVRGGGNFSLALDFARSPRDLSGFLYVATDLRNLGKTGVTMMTRVEDPDYAGWHHYSGGVMRLAPGESATALVLLKRKAAPPDTMRALFPGMQGLPGGYLEHWNGLDPARISKVRFFLEAPGTNAVLEWSNLRASGRLAWPDTNRGFFPFLDRFGQYRHAEWPTKVHSTNDLVTQRRAEVVALSHLSDIAAWDKVGGWKLGPRLKATGHFRVEQLDGKWWFVDPEGRLFWSHGTCCVWVHSTTPCEGRRHFFSEIPESTNGGADYYLSNLRFKYGADAERQALMFAHQRLRAWGLNTMGAWSEPVATAMKRTPYTAILRIDAPRIAPGLDVPDVYDRAFPKAVRAACEVERRASGDDPWCIGVFVDNEIEWRNGPEIVPEILTAPAEQPGKRALCSFLRQRHGNIAKLNAAWSTAFRTWTDWLVSTNKFSPPGAEKDLAAFNEDLTDRYYRIAAQVFKRAMPYRLNLGTRFHTGNRAAIRAAAKYCDVVSFNKYAHSVRGIPLPEGINRPILVGEFHFAAWDRSFTASPARSALSLAQRADAYRYYVASALDDPRVVGVHWFQYLDQPLTGRADGENWPVGFVDVTDTPYESLTAASREIGELMYQRRSANRAIRP